ncbi:conserved hypothetical protein [Leptothrix cholodnii SP-6]|uniref:Cytoskeleton protein RodZ-like C-terminal domain-containing protein n=1 Tax=Leptothrix cholodnii (strain ATCC 51168 / LMG 8142 / SP-6) TaxID=395495 RepID=B1XXL4_LEPCP|nr:helix-turn-helix domain-containing protein [Leptothrix cholodnii]ACB35134.1 conserved hypothetical protein [Leptothrix cholodnii SP-6]
MSEPKSPASATPSAEGARTSAGALLRAAREARGLELDQFALLLKVPVPKLQALEADRLDQLPGLAFVRGLATAIARQLEIDPQPILAALPAAAQAPQALENVTRGLATPYREPGSRMLPGSWPEWLRPGVIVPALLLLLALLFWLAPPMRALMREPVAAAASAVQATVAASQAVTNEVRSADGADNGGAVSTTLESSASAVVETVHSAPPEEPASSQNAAAAGSVVLRTSADSWIEARDGAGALLMSRMLPAGEVVGLDGSLPIRLKIGNADGTRLHFRGQPIDLNPHTRDNVARLELK